MASDQAARQVHRFARMPKARHPPPSSKRSACPTIERKPKVLPRQRDVRVEEHQDAHLVRRDVQLVPRLWHHGLGATKADALCEWGLIEMENCVDAVVAMQNT